MAQAKVSVLPLKVDSDEVPAKTKMKKAEKRFRAPPLPLPQCYHFDSYAFCCWGNRVDFDPLAFCCWDARVGVTVFPAHWGLLWLLFLCGSFTFLEP